MCKFRIRCRNRRRFFRWFYDTFQESPKIKFGIFLVLLYPMFYILIQVTRIERIKVFVLDKESDIEGNLPQGSWTIKQWDYVKDTNLHSLFKEYGMSPRDFESEAKNEFWLAAKKKSEETLQNSYSFHLDKFQYHYPVETTVALRFYIAGPGKLEIIFRDAFQWEIKTYTIIPNPDHHRSTSTPVDHRAGEISKNYTLFCSHIVPLVFEGLVDKVEIKATVETGDTFIAIDSLFVTMGKHGGSRNLMLTMIPSNWCTNEYLHSWNPEKDTSPKRRNVMDYR